MSGVDIILESEDKASIKICQAHLQAPSNIRCTALHLLRMTIDWLSECWQSPNGTLAGNHRSANESIRTGQSNFVQQGTEQMTVRYAPQACSCRASPPAGICCAALSGMYVAGQQAWHVSHDMMKVWSQVQRQQRRAQDLAGHCRLPGDHALCGVLLFPRAVPAEGRPPAGPSDPAPWQDDQCHGPDDKGLPVSIPTGKAAMLSCLSESGVHGQSMQETM